MRRESALRASPAYSEAKFGAIAGRMRSLASSRFALTSPNRDIRFAIMRWRTPACTRRFDVYRVDVL
jgi:hypothetical protein